MAFENLLPIKSEIERLRKDGLTLTQTVERLHSEFGVTTSIGTLSRFLKQASPAHAVRKATPDEGRQIDVMALFVELLSEVRGGREEARAALEHLAGQVRVLHETQRGVPASNKQLSSPPQTPKKEKRQAFLTGIAIGLFIALALLGIGAGVAVYLGWGS